MRPGSANPARRKNTASTAALLTSSKSGVVPVDTSSLPSSKPSKPNRTNSMQDNNVTMVNSVINTNGETVKTDNGLLDISSTNSNNNSLSAQLPKCTQPLSLLGSSKGRALLRRSRMMNRLNNVESSDDSDDDTDTGSSTN